MSEAPKERDDAGELAPGLALEAAGVGGWAWDRESGRVVGDGRWQGLLGLAAPAVAEDELLARVHPDDRPRLLAWAERAVAGDAPQICEIRATTAAGEARWVELRGRAIAGSTRLAGVALDVDARRRAAVALGEGARRDRFFVEHSLDAMFIQGLDLRYVWMCRPPPPFTVEQCVGKDDFDLHDPEIARRIVAPKLLVLEHGVVQRREISFTVEGELKAFEATYEPWYGPTGEIVGVAGLVRDVSAYRRSEAALREAKAAADAANAAKSHFLANMSHELRTPMNAILGMTDLALREATSASLRDHLHTVQDAGEALLELVDQLLDFSRIEAGQMALDRAPFELRRVLAQVARTLGVRAGEKGLALRCEVDEALPEVVVGDPLRLRQVLFNLVGNAIKFTHAGAVLLSARPLAADDAAIVVDFAVADTGIGIAAADQEQIFSPFTQTDASISRKYGGSGLGLAIVRSLVEMMGGEVRLDSEPGRGSTFSFALRLGRHEGGPLGAALPRSEREARRERGRAGADGEARGPAPRPLQVLLAEDTPANQKLVDYILRERGHTVTIAGDGREALERLIHAPYDVVLMDIQMPELDGFEATRAIRGLADPRRAQVPIVAITAHALRGDAERCLAAGMDAYIPKPIARERLVSVVEGLAERFRGAFDPEPPPAAEPAALDEVAPFDPGEALRMCFGDRAMLRAMIECLADEAGPRTAELRAALAAGDGEALVGAAHRLKNTVLYLGAEPAVAATERLVALGRSGDLDAAPAAVDRLEEALERLQAALTEIDVDRA